MTRTHHPIAEFMTPVPATISSDSTLVDALQTMRALSIRHLPVVTDGRLQGTLSLPEVALCEQLGHSMETTLVRQVMQPKVLEVDPSEAVTRVARRMATEKVECAVVVDHGKTVGILTTTDTLVLLADSLAVAGSIVPRNRMPSEIRARIHRDHDALRGRLERVEALAERALRDEPVQSEMFSAATGLYDHLLQHIDLEDELLAPHLNERPGNGARQARAMLDKHHEQREQLLMGRSMVAAGDVEHLAESLLLLSHWVKIDMKEEESVELSAAAMSDSPVVQDAEVG